MEFLYLTTQWWHVCDEHFKILQDSVEICFRWSGKFCSKFIPETIRKILSKSLEFCRRYHKKTFWSLFFHGHIV